MIHDAVRFNRGQIWVIRFKHPEQVGHEIQKDRPWLVISLGNYNESSGMITCIPITTRASTVAPSQILFKNTRNVYNVLLCEQIRSFDYRSGEYLFDYMSTVSDDILEKVDVALSIHTGMHYSPITLTALYDTMESIIKSVGYMQEKNNTPKFSEEDVVNFTNKLCELSTPAEQIPLQVDSVEKQESITPVKDEEATPTTKVKKRIRWTIEKRDEFLADVDSLPISKVMEKWDIPSKSRFYSMKNYVLNLKKEEGNL